MFLSPREIELLTELMTSSAPVSVNKMMNLLKVSRRTVYRELENLEHSLQAVGAELKKVSRGKYVLAADEAARQTIQAAITGEESYELSAVERQHAILLELLTGTAPLSMQYFADTYMVSSTTFYGDIKQLEASLLQLPLSISRNMGYELVGPEKYRRLLQANILGIEVNEYQFFHLDQMDEQDNFFFRFIDQGHLLFAKSLILEDVSVLFPALSDRKLEFLILMLAIAMTRVSQGFVLLEDSLAVHANKELLNTSKQLFAKVAQETKLLYPISEIVFFASLLSGFSSSFDQDFLDERFDSHLAYLVKQLIGLVSQETDVNFFEDANLYKMLLTHLSGVFSRTALQGTELANPILERIMEQYAEIADAIRLSLPKVFDDKQLSEEEIAYMVLHFANSLERSPVTMEIDIAGISPSGLASTSMLEMRLRRYFPFINTIHFFRIADLGKIDLENTYDLIISTSILPGYTGKYKLVSPLLLDDELKQLKDEFKKIRHQNTTALNQPKKQDVSEDSYEEVLAVIEAINGLLARFFVAKLKNTQDVADTVSLVVEALPESVVSDRQTVQEKLLDRYRQAPIGIPDTNMALFHASTDAVTLPCFCVFDLEVPLTINGMDKQPMDLTRMLVMLAPSPVDEKTSVILGKISGSIIMNDLNLEIFNSGNSAIMYQLLSSLLIEEVKK